MLPSTKVTASALALTVHFGAGFHGLRAPCERFAARVTTGSRITRFRLVIDLGRTGFDTCKVPNEVSI
jgi:hypothetical protein